MGIIPIMSKTLSRRFYTAGTAWIQYCNALLGETQDLRLWNQVWGIGLWMNSWSSAWKGGTGLSSWCRRFLQLGLKIWSLCNNFQTSNWCWYQVNWGHASGALPWSLHSSLCFRFALAIASLITFPLVSTKIRSTGETICLGDAK